jgi:uncharacterized RDD family membrane protein YckC
MVESTNLPLRSAPASPFPPSQPSSTTDTIEIFERKGENIALRFSAVWLDSLLLEVVSVIAAIALAVFLSLLNLTGDILWVLVVLSWLGIYAVSWVTYFTLLEGTFGTTLGKYLGVYPFRLRVIRLNGGRIGYGQAAVRAMIGFFETNIIGAVVIMSTGLQQRLGDLAAGTLVVDETKLRKVDFLGDRVRFEFLDGHVEELIRVTGGNITKWMGIPQSMKIEGVNIQGNPVSIRLNVIRGSTVFSNEAKMDQLRVRVEDRFRIRFTESLQWERLVLLLLIVPIILICLAGFILAVFLAPIGTFSNYS